MFLKFKLSGKIHRISQFVFLRGMYGFKCISLFSDTDGCEYHYKSLREMNSDWEGFNFEKVFGA